MCSSSWKFGLHVFRGEGTGEAASTLVHARQAVDYAERVGSHTSRIFAYHSLGLAKVLNGAWCDALEALGTALTIGRERRLKLFEGGVLATMAAAHLGLGDRTKALGLAQEAIAVSRRRGSRFYEFSALLTQIRALREIHGIQLQSVFAMMVAVRGDPLSINAISPTMAPAGAVAKVRPPR
jgi:hypothetical protein